MISIQDLPLDLIEDSKKLLQQGKDYDDFFKASLKKFGVNSPADFKSDEEKKKFFDYIDKNYKGEKEEEVEEGKAKISKQYLKLGDCSYEKKKKVEEDNSKKFDDLVAYKYKSSSINKIKSDLKKLMKDEAEFPESQKSGKMLLKLMDNIVLANDDGVPYMTDKFAKDMGKAYFGDTAWREEVASIIIKHDDNLASAIFGV